MTNSLKKAGLYTLGAVFFSFIALFLYAGSASAATITWDGGGGDNNWSTGLNWDGDTAPGASDDVVFDATSTKDSTIDSSHGGEIASLTISSGYTGTITNSKSGFTVSGASGYSQAAGTFDMNGNKVIIGVNSVRVAADFAITGGTFTNIAGGADLDVYGDISLSNCTFNANMNYIDAHGNITVGSSVTWTPNSSTILWYDGDATVSSTTFDVDSTLELYGLWIYGNDTQSFAAGDTITITDDFELQAGTANIASTGSGTTLVVQAASPVIDVESIAAAGVDIKFTGTGNVNVNWLEDSGDTGIVNFEVDKSSGTVTFTGSDDCYFNNLTITNGTLTCAGLTTGIADITGNVTIASGGTFIAPAAVNMNIGGNFTNNGTFTHSSGTTVFNDASGTSTFTGDTIFYNLSCTTDNKALEFTALSRTSVANNLTLTGTSGNEIVLTSSSPGTRYGLYVEGTPSVEYVDVTDSDASGATFINATNSTDGGNNLNWFTAWSEVSSPASDVAPKTYYIDLTIPESDLSLSPGDMYEITWNTSGSGPTSAVDLSYTTDEGLTYNTIATTQEDDGAYSWTVPGIAAESIQIRVQGTDLVDPVSEDTSHLIYIIQNETEEPEEPEDPEIPTTCGVEGITIGDFVRSAEFPAVYYISGECSRKVFLNSQTFFTWADNFDSVKTISSDDLNNYELVGVMLPQPGVVLVKIQSDPKVYTIEEDENGDYLLRWIHSEALAIEMYGENWADYVIDLEATTFARYKQGPDATLGSPDHDPLKLKKRVDLHD